MPTFTLRPDLRDPHSPTLPCIPKMSTTTRRRDNTMTTRTRRTSISECFHRGDDDNELSVPHFDLPKGKKRKFLEEEPEEDDDSYLDVLDTMFEAYPSPPTMYCKRIAMILCKHNKMNWLDETQIRRIDNSLYYYIGPQNYGSILSDLELKEYLEKLMGGMNNMGLSWEGVIIETK